MFGSGLPDPLSNPEYGVRLPASLRLDRDGDVALLRLARANKRNALNDETIQGIETFFRTPPEWSRAAVLWSDGEHFSAGLDLNELTERDTLEGLEHSMQWHRAFSALESGTIPVVSVLKGAVVGGGMELAAASHIRVAETSAFYALPEGQRGLFLGGGGSVRLPRLIGANRVADMMLTGRVLSSSEGQALGFSNYLVDDGDGLDRALDLAKSIAGNAPATNFGVMHVLPSVAEIPPAHGYVLEALMASAASGSDEAKRRMHDFLRGRGAKVTRGNGSPDARS